MCVQIFHMVNIDVPASVGASTQLATPKHGKINNQRQNLPFNMLVWPGLTQVHPKLFAHHIKSCVLLKQLSHKFTLQSCVWIFQIWVMCSVELIN